jgi:hypothetical protein
VVRLADEGGAEHLVRTEPVPACFGSLQTAFQIAPDRVGQFRVFIDELRNLLQQWIQCYALPHELQIGKTDLRVVLSHDR